MQAIILLYSQKIGEICTIIKLQNYAMHREN